MVDQRQAPRGPGVAALEGDQLGIVRVLQMQRARQTVQPAQVGAALVGDLAWRPFVLQPAFPAFGVVIGRQLQLRPPEKPSVQSVGEIGARPSEPECLTALHEPPVGQQALAGVDDDVRFHVVLLGQAAVEIDAVRQQPLHIVIGRNAIMPPAGALPHLVEIKENRLPGLLRLDDFIPMGIHRVEPAVALEIPCPIGAAIGREPQLPDLPVAAECIREGLGSVVAHHAGDLVALPLGPEDLAQLGAIRLG